MSDSAVLYRGSISPDEAVDRLRARITNVKAIHETVDLADAAGRIIARDLIAPTNLPASNNAAVDGMLLMLPSWRANRTTAFR